MQQEVRNRMRGRRYRPRLVVIVDSDRKAPGATASITAQRLHRTCTQGNLPCWILAKREAENYLPGVLLSARPGTGSAHAQRVAVWSRLTDDQKNFIDVKNGIPATLCAAESNLFGGLSAFDRQILSHDPLNELIEKDCWSLWDVPARQELEFHREPRDGLGPHHFPVWSLLNTASFFEACRRIQSDVRDPGRGQRLLDEADRLASAFRDYQLPLVHIREADLDSAVTVFARLNRTGRKMPADEMVSALTYQAGQFHLAERLNEFKAELAPRGFGNVDRVFLLRAVLAALDRDIYAKDWADVMVKRELRGKLPDAFEDAAGGILRALKFLKKLGVTSDRMLPYGLQLVLLGEFFRRCPEPAEGIVKLLTRWFWVTTFTGWFGGVNTAQAKRALTEINQLADGTGSGFSVIDLDTPAQPFPERFDGRSARVRAFLLYLASLGPHSLQGAGALDPGELLSAKGMGGVGYVFGRQAGLAHMIRSPANRMFVDRSQSGQVFGVLEKMDDHTLTELLPTHGFHADSIRRLRVMTERG